MSRIFLTNINLSQNELQNARIQNLATNPTSPVAGQIYYNTGDNTLRYYNGSAWLTLAQGGSVNDAIAAYIATITTNSISEGSTNLYFTDERAQDAIGNAVGTGLSYNDTTGAISVNTSVIATASSVTNAINALSTTDIEEGTNLYYTDERAQDAIANAIALGTHSNITITYDDATNKFTFAAENGVADSNTDNLSEGSTNKYFTDERAQDAVGNAVGTGLTYNDSTGAISVTANTYDAYGSASTVAGNLTTHESDTSAHGVTGNVVGTTDTQTLTNKTLTSPKINEDVVLTATATELNYVDGVTSAIQTQLDAKLALAGGTMTGAIAMGTNKITGLGTPTADTDAATKAYVDAARSGLDVKASVRAATTAGITLSGEQTIDGVSVVAGDRVLVKNQGTGSENGIYVASASGWSRADDANISAEVTAGMFTFVAEGTVNADSGWVLTTNDAITLGTTALAFAQFSGAGQITAGAGLTKNGNTLDAVGTADRITVNADSIDIASTYAGQNTITTVGTITTGTWNGTAIAIANGGTGATTAAGARTNLGATTKYTEANLLLQPASGSVTWVVNHGLGTRNSNVQVFELSSYAQVEVDVVRTNTNAVTLSWVASANVAADSYQVVVVA
jgi:hypothetical protein